MSQMPSAIAAMETTTTEAGDIHTAQSTSIGGSIGSASAGDHSPRPDPDQYPHHVLFVVHGMGRQLEEFGNYERNDFNNHYGSEIIRIIVDELNTAYSTFMSKHPGFNGKIAVYALSLGGIAVFDILTCIDDDAESKDNGETATEIPAHNSTPPENGLSENMDDRGATATSSAMKAKIRKQDQPKFKAVVPKLKFRPHILFTVGSPIGAVMVMRNLEWEHFHPPDDILHHNIFHPFDPLAYRIEPLIDPTFAAIPAVTLNSTGNSQLFPISLPSFIPSLPESISSFWETKVPALPIPSIPKLSTLSQMTQSLKGGRWLPGVGGGASGGTNDFTSEENPITGTQGRAGDDDIARAVGGSESSVGASEGQQAQEYQDHSGRSDRESATSQGVQVPHKEGYSSGIQDSSISITEALAAATVATYLNQKDNGDTTTAPPDRNNDFMLDGGITTTTTGLTDAPLGPTRTRPSLGPRRISSRIEGDEEALNQSSSSVKAADNNSTRVMEKVNEDESTMPTVTSAGREHMKNEQAKVTQQGASGTHSEQGPEDKQAGHVGQNAGRSERSCVTVEEDERTDEHQENPTAKEKQDGMDEAIMGEGLKSEDTNTARAPIHVRGRATKVPYRIDHVLQETRVDQYTNEYLLGMRSHFRYWDNRDIAHHILKTMLQQDGDAEGQVLDLEPEMPAPVTASKGAKEAAMAKAKATAEARRHKDHSSVADAIADEDSHSQYKSRGHRPGDDSESLSGYRFQDLDMSIAADAPFSNNTLYQNSPFAKRGSLYGDAAPAVTTSPSVNDATNQSDSPPPAPVEGSFVVPDLPRPPRLHHRSPRIE
ncbi:hypothetical protein BGX31_003685 [Mortierella sp. GBA43]|nr:hypothetical protein BGX31_003685 [Mortierella sp. GBA43]